MDTEKQRQRRRDDVRLTESGNARSEQLLVVPSESLTNREWLPGELLNGLERQRPGWFLRYEISDLFLPKGFFSGFLLCSLYIFIESGAFSQLQTTV